MKSLLTLTFLLVAKVAIFSGNAWSVDEIARGSLSGHDPGSRELVVAQAVGAEDQTDSHRETLDTMLERDDFIAAEEYVDALSNDADVTSLTLRSLSSEIRRVRTARILDYAEKIRAAIASSDFEAVRDLSERMEHMRSASPSSNPASISNTERRSPKIETDLVQPAEESQPGLDVGNEPTAQPSTSQEDSILDQRIQVALNEDRLFPPAADNAFDLAVARLSMEPHDDEARDILDDVIKRQQSQALANLQDGRPEVALDLTKQLLGSVGSLQAEEAATAPLWSSAERWVQQTRPDIIAGLVTNTEQAIDDDHLTVSPNGKLSAEGYVSLLAEELGQNHTGVERLANLIIDKYQGLIDQHLANNRHNEASAFHNRMEATARRFGLPTDRVAALGSHIQLSQARQQQHDQLLLVTAQWRGKGQLIEPAGANALEFAGKAVQLAVDPEAADKVFKDVIAEQRGKIDRLIDAGRLEEAADQLQQLGSAIQEAAASRTEDAAVYYAEAEQILRQADLEKTQRQQKIEEAEQDDFDAAAPVEPARTEKPTFTFINPF